MSKVLWIIGNGFDKNLGLNTGYRSFLLNKYFAPGAENKYRDELVRRLGKFEPESQSDLWSDLESLLGKVTELYEDDVELFHDTFEDMQHQLLEYVAQESERLPDEIPSAAIDEFRESGSRCVCFRVDLQNWIRMVLSRRLVRLKMLGFLPFRLTIRTRLICFGVRQSMKINYIHF